MIDIAGNIERVLSRIECAARKAGTDASEIKIVAITKTHPAEVLIEAYRAGLKCFGENKVQEAEAKFARLKNIAPDIDIERHFVGHLQTNKINKALKLFDLIQSVDSFKLGSGISKRAKLEGREVDILLQVNTSAEDSKFGVAPDKAVDLITELAQLPHLRIRGLMTIGAFLPEAEMTRPCFAKLRHLSEQIKKLNLPKVKMEILSMGMTNDFEVAIEEGANMVRIGTAIFGPRE